MNLATEGRLRPQKRNFRVVAVDTFPWPNEDHLVGDFDSLDEAVAAARSHCAEMQPCYVYDKHGHCIFTAGKP